LVVRMVEMLLLSLLLLLLILAILSLLFDETQAQVAVGKAQMMMLPFAFGLCCCGCCLLLLLLLLLLQVQLLMLLLLLQLLLQVLLFLRGIHHTLMQTDTINQTLTQAPGEGARDVQFVGNHRGGGLAQYQLLGQGNLLGIQLDASASLSLVGQAQSGGNKPVQNQKGPLST